MIFFEADFLTVTWDEANQWIITEWRGYSGGGTGKAQIGSNKILELIREKHATKLLNDFRQMQISDRADQNWFAEEWLPQAIKAGLQYTANVLPKSALGQLSLQNTQAQAKGLELERANFDNLEAAQKWLHSVSSH